MHAIKDAVQTSTIPAPNSNTRAGKLRSSNGAGRRAIWIPSYALTMSVYHHDDRKICLVSALAAMRSHPYIMGAILTWLHISAWSE